MHNSYPQMGCSDGGMGYYHAGLGTYIYDEGGQMGNLGADPLTDLTNILKQQFPGFSNQVIGQYLSSTTEGQNLVKQGQAVGAQAAAAQLAAQDASIRQQLQAQYQSMISDVQSNYKKYLTYLAIALAAGVGIWLVWPSLKKVASPAAMQTASNPRRRRHKRSSHRRAKRKSR